jgi:hypothetical protein
MAYAPVGGGALPGESFEPSLPSSDNLDIWPAIAERAERYWREVAGSEHVSSGFAAIAARNAASVSRARKLLP